MKREEKKRMKIRKNEKREKRKHKLLHTDKQIDRQTDKHKSFIDMRNNTEQCSKSNSIKENRIE